LGITYDPYFKYVTLLLHGDGTNGAQNNTFLDSSTNNFTITRNGNTTQGTFTPYGANWSNYFSGSSQYLNAPTNAAFAFGTSDFTIEAWIYCTALSGVENFIFDSRSSASTAGMGFNIEPTTGKLRYSGSANNVLTTTSITTNTWIHVAWVRSGSTLTGYINGVSGGSVSNTDNLTQTVGAVGVVGFAASGYFNGYMSNVRVVKGTAVYTANFTPSTAPLTAITNTSLLTCQSNRFIDTSTNAFAITITGSPSIQRFSPFSPSTAYSTSVIGGSGYFDGSGDYLSTPTLATIGSGDFSQEAWVYTQSSTGTPLFWDAGSGAGTFLLLNGTTSILGGINGSVVSTGTYTIPLNAWTHLAYCRSGTTLSIFANGARIATGTVSTSAASGSYAIGIAKDITRPFTGFMSGVRFVHGASAYDATLTTLTVPTAPVTAITSTTLLLSTTNAGIYDNAMINDLETVGNAQVSTSVVKFGTGSMYFNGSGSYLVSNPASTQLYSYGGDFTIEFWLYRNATGQTILFDSRPTGGGGASAYYVLYVSSGSVVLWNTSNTNRITGTTTLSNSTWYHIAVSRSGSSTKLFLNGTQEGSTYTDSTALICAAKRPYVGVDANDGTSALNGYIDDLRVTNGYARYTTTFTPPTAAFPNQ
jgi:hypothetical protein